MITSEKQDVNSSVEFLIAEYSQINGDIIRLRSEGLSRLNFFITITSSILAGLIALSQFNSVTNDTIQLISIGALVFLILNGWTVFKFTIVRDINTDFNIRAASRIRRYFVNHDSSLGQYLTWQDHDKPTSFLTETPSSTIRGAAQSILSFLFALNNGLIVYLFFSNLFWSIAIGSVSFIIGLFGLYTYVKGRFEKARREARDTIRFPESAFRYSKDNLSGRFQNAAARAGEDQTLLRSLLEKRP